MILPIISVASPPTSVPPYTTATMTSLVVEKRTTPNPPSPSTVGDARQLPMPPPAYYQYAIILYIIFTLFLKFLKYGRSIHISFGQPLTRDALLYSRDPLPRASSEPIRRTDSDIATADTSDTAGVALPNAAAESQTA